MHANNFLYYNQISMSVLLVLLSVMPMPTALILLAVTSVPAILDMKGMDLSVLVSESYFTYPAKSMGRLSWVKMFTHCRG